MTRDLRRYARDTNIRLVIGFLLLVFIVGEGLIYIVYGLQAALLGFACLVAAMLPVFAVILILLVLNWIARRSDGQ